MKYLDPKFSSRPASREYRAGWERTFGGVDDVRIVLTPRKKPGKDPLARFKVRDVIDHMTPWGTPVRMRTYAMTMPIGKSKKPRRRP